MGTRMVHAWTVEPCHRCGTEFYLTRQEPTTLDEKEEALCSECGAYSRGYEDGKNALAHDMHKEEIGLQETAIEDARRWRAQIQVLEEEIEQLKAKGSGVPLSERIIRDYLALSLWADEAELNSLRAFLTRLVRAIDATVEDSNGG